MRVHLSDSEAGPVREHLSDGLGSPVGHSVSCIVQKSHPQVVCGAHLLQVWAVCCEGGGVFARTVPLSEFTIAHSQQGQPDVPSTSGLTWL